MRDSDVKYISNRYPLIEKAMTRTSCLLWVEKRGFPRPPKSSCLGCPFHSDAHWKMIRDTSPEEWQETIQIDEAIRESIPGLHSKAFMHRSCMPLSEVPFEDDNQLDFFTEECQGVCFT